MMMIPHNLEFAVSLRSGDHNYFNWRIKKD